MNIGQLKQLIEDAGLPDSTEILARDRDCINLEAVDVVGGKIAPIPEDQPWAESKDLREGYEEKYGVDTSFNSIFKGVYGGGNWGDDAPTHAIIFCDND